MQAGVYVDRAVEHFASDPVYVDPAAKPTLSAAEADRLRDEIGQVNAGPVYIAILPAAARNEAGGDAGALLRDLYESVGERATYAVVAGGQFRAGSNYYGFKKGEVPKLATEAFKARHAEGLATTLLDFVDRLGSARSSGGSGGGGAGRPFWLVALVVLGGGAAIHYVTRQRRRQRREAAQLAQVSETARGDLVAFADDIDRVRADIKDPEAHKELEKSLELYDQASHGLDGARRPANLEQVSAALAEGRYQISRAQARQDGRPVPERTPPCFFDPRHGPSAREVDWAPPGGATRKVPACEADAQRVERGEEPAAREIQLAGRSVPYYTAPAYFGPYYGGFGLGGFFPGLFLGELLGGGLSGGSYGAPAGTDFGGESGGGADLGDFGGGSFGGGDFGGGGGDSGGGGGGGGDF